MTLLHDGTVIRKGSSPFYKSFLSEGSDETQQSYETAPIENVTKVIEGLCATLTFTFKAVEGETLQPPPHSGPGCVFLCAEDNQVNQRLLAKILGKFGQDFVMTANGQQAVEVYKSNPDRYPVILMDLQMPVMDGMEATTLIRTFNDSQPGHRRPFILGLSAHALLPPHSPFFSWSHYDALMVKPFILGKMYEMFFGGPETNVLFLYGNLTEEEKSVYPRLVERNTTLGDDARSNAIREEVKRFESEWTDDFGQDTRYVYVKIIVKVVENGEYGQDIN
ncbi:hypothetical protein NPX13_g5499 [Xylaria arbuscula]|uniref:Response regulatory domain-containing protein n=1 Tax=Xylaria arbuscula TaxID=114810 RepID=A0A9W8NDK0_9PEZI|nr:hypothetical protein NPX13_g5499 [Xylaria arbuscula]